MLFWVSQGLGCGKGLITGRRNRMTGGVPGPGVGKIPGSGLHNSRPVLQRIVSGAPHSEGSLKGGSMSVLCLPGSPTRKNWGPKNQRQTT